MSDQAYDVVPDFIISLLRGPYHVYVFTGRACLKRSILLRENKVPRGMHLEYFCLFRSFASKCSK